MSKDLLKGIPFEVVERDTGKKVERDYPRLYMDKLKLVDTQSTRLAIDDVSYCAKESIQEYIELLALSCKGWLEVYDAESLIQGLSQKIGEFLTVLDKEKSLLIFPGNGAKVLKDLMPEELVGGFPSIEISTQRKVDPQTGAVLGVDIIRKPKIDTKIDNILIVDDVIATGTTLRAIKDSISLRNANWFACSMMTLSPIQNRQRSKESACGIDGYSSITCPIVYQGTTGTPPLNSLSNFIGVSEKSEMVRERYIQKYVKDIDSFKEA